MITTYSNNGNILIGDLKVKKVDELEELRDELLKKKHKLIGVHEVFVERDLGGCCSVLTEGFMRKDNVLIHQYVTDVFGDSDDCLYTKAQYKCKCLNSILLFTSLLGELRSDKYNQLVQEFIKLGIIHCAPIDYVWKQCSKNMIEDVYSEIELKDIKDIRKVMMADLKVFRFALMEGIISYDVQEEIPFSNKVKIPKFSAETKYDWKQTEINKALLLADDSLFKEYIKKRKKIC